MRQAGGRERWTPAQAQEWHARQPWLIGCNYIPSNAINQLEMWQAETFDETVNDRELGWAESIGFNAVRVYLHDLLWATDADGLLDRMDRFLDIARAHGIRTLFVLLDGVWDPQPRPGRQPAPRPGIHNPGWVQSPGAEILGDPARHGEVRDCVSGVIGHFRDDERVLGWDLFNEPDNPNPAYGDRELPNKGEMAFALLRKAFAWAREARSSQPLTAGLWRPQWVTAGALSPIDELQLAESDVISFHAYTPAHLLEARIGELQAYGRPLLLTEYLARPFGSTFEAVLPLARRLKVGVFSWGLVAGKTQTVYPWDSWAKRYEGEPDPWFHDIFRPDGTPYREEEVALIRRLARE